MLKFGTDGLRGTANVDLTPELALALGRASARVLGDRRWAVGRDTRRSGPMLEAAFAAGLTAEGADVLSLGVAPTPQVAWWAAQEGAPAAVVSASHNPYEDNGIKLFAAGGLKLTDELEERLEAQLPAAGPLPDRPRVDAGTVGLHDDRQRYSAAVAGSLEGRRLDGLRLLVDCANGAATPVAPALLRSLGCEVEVLHGAPDGVNINRGCGSTHPESLQEMVKARRADAGVAFDGDADRLLLVDSGGNLVDGDQIMAILARDLAARNRLGRNTVVVTVMTNLGFRLAMAGAGVDVVETPVGDRYVLEALEAGGYSLGGEQSGHVIFRDMATTGDGILTAVQALDVVQRTGRPLADLAAAAMTRLPQVLRSVRVLGQERVMEQIAGEVATVETELGDHGRVLVRPSGTEPLIRVMVEAPTEETAAAAADRLIRAAEAAAPGATRPESTKP